MNDDFLWVEKYRPQTIQQCILAKELKQCFQKFVDDNAIPHLLLSGPPGIGKTTVARAMLEQIQADYIVINGSLSGTIDVLRNQIAHFASTASLVGGRKYVILDEADHLSASFQPAMRNFMEEFSANCGFILTCNYKNKIIQPLHSRCSVIDFSLPNKEKAHLAVEFLNRIQDILTNEQISFDKNVVAEFIKKYFPDWRRIINELQRYSARGAIDSGILESIHNVSIKQLVQHLRDKRFSEVRKWVGENSDIETNALFDSLYKVLSDELKPTSIPQLVLHLADYQYKAAFVADQEINTTALLVEIMTDCTWRT